MAILGFSRRVQRLIVPGERNKVWLDDARYQNAVARVFARDAMKKRS